MSKLTFASSWGFLLLVIISFVVMIFFMMKDTPDFPYKALQETAVRTGPASSAPVITTLPAQGAVLCHGLVESSPGWLDCSDMLEKKYLLAEDMVAISEEEFDQLQ